MASEPILNRGRIPAGYAFVPKGNVYITGTCRKQTEAANQTVYRIVNSKDKRLGIAVPIIIHKDVQKKEVETRAARAVNVDRRDASIKTVFEQVIMKEFPHLPRAELAKVLAMSLKKGVGKVGRTGQLEDRKKAQLAVRAHIRHCHTNYDKLLKGSQRGRGGMKVKRDARKAVQSQIDALAVTWKSGRASQSPLRSGPAKTVLLGKNEVTTTTSASVLGQLPLPSAPAIRTAARVVHVGKLQVSRILEAPTQPRRQIEVIDLTMDDDESPEPKKTSVAHQQQQQGGGQGVGMINDARLYLTEAQQNTTLRLIQATEKNLATLDALQKTKDLWAHEIFSITPKDSMAVANSDEWGSQRADRVWMRIQDRATRINESLNGAVGFKPIPPAQGPAKLKQEVEQLRMAVVGSWRVKEDKLPVSVPRLGAPSGNLAKRSASTDADRRLSQYFSGMSVFERELS